MALEVARRLINNVWQTVVADEAAGGGGSSPFLTTTATLTDAQIKTLPTSFVEVIPAPGAGKMIIPLQVILHLKNWHADYTNINAQSRIQIGLGGAAGLAPLGGILSEQGGGMVSTLLAGQGPDGTWSLFPPAARGLTLSAFPAIPQASGDSGWYDSDVENQAVTIYANNVADGNWTGGDPAQSLDVISVYQTLDI